MPKNKKTAVTREEAEANEFNELVKNIPNRTWVALSSDRKKIIGKGVLMEDVRMEAREHGVQDPILYCIQHWPKKK